MRKSKIVEALIMTTISLALLGIIHVTGETPSTSTIKPNSSGNDIKVSREISAFDFREEIINNAEKTKPENTEIASIQKHEEGAKDIANEVFNFDANVTDEISDKAKVMARKSDMSSVSRGGYAKVKERKSNEEIANEVINGTYGNGEERKARLESEGYDYSLIQKEISKIMPTPPKQELKAAPQNNPKSGNVIKAQQHSQFKSYMPWTALSKSSPQGKLCAKAHKDGRTAVMMYNGRYLVALGKAYANYIGEEIDVVMESGQVIPVTVGDWKATKDTINNSTHKVDGSIIEFIVSSNKEASATVNGSGSYDVIFPGKVKEFRK